MTKKVDKNMFFSLITNFLLLLKDKMGLRMKNFNIFGVHWKIRFLWGMVFTKNIGRGGIA